MFAIVNSLNAVIGPIMTIAAFIAIVITVRSNIGDLSSKAQHNAIIALQAEMDVQKQRIDALKEENSHQGRIIQTICDALKQKGITITIEGEIISIEGLESHKSATIVRIQDKENGA